MKREITAWRYTIRADRIEPGFTDADEAALLTWVTTQMKDHELRWLLAHATDGVIWGSWMDGQLALSGYPDHFPKFSPPLHPRTLLQARLFGDNQEIFLWRGGDGAWRYRLLDDTGTEREGFKFDEVHLQWGDHAEEQRGRFTLVAEGVEGLQHAVPLPKDAITFDQPYPLRLKVHHYLEQDKDDGTLYIVQSRLVELYIQRRNGAVGEGR